MNKKLAKSILELNECLASLLELLKAEMAAHAAATLMTVMIK